MSGELKGKVIQVKDQETGPGKNGNWYKQIFAIETDGQYPKKVAFQVWGDLCDQIPPVGSEVKVSYNLESREYNEKWYTDAKPYKIDVLSTTGDPGKVEKTGLGLEETQTNNEDDLPF